MLKYLRILVIVMGVVSFFCFVLFGFGSLVIFCWLAVLGFLDFFGVGGWDKVCIRKR